MLIDDRLEFADAMSVAAAAGTYLATDWVDIRDVGGPAGTLSANVTRDVGQGLDIFLVVSVDTSIITGGAAGTIQFQLVTDDNTSFSSPQIVAQSAAIATGAAGVAGTTAAGSFPWMVQLPPFQYERYIGVRYIIATTTTTAGAVSAYMTLDPQLYRAYADNVPGTV